MRCPDALTKIENIRWRKGPLQTLHIRQLNITDIGATAQQVRT